MLLTPPPTPAGRDDHPVPPPREAGGLTTLICRLDQLGPRDLAHWSQLSDSCPHPNIFQQPEFVLPLVRHLVPPADVRVIVVRRHSDRDWLFANLVIDRPPSTSRPLRHFRSLTSPYSFLDHPLAAASDWNEVAKSLCAALAGQRRWHGIRYRQLSTSGDLWSGLSSAAEAHGVRAFHDRRWERPLAAVTGASETELLSEMSKSRRKSLKKAWSRLSERGRVEYRLRTPGVDDFGPAEEFLRLESLGWKGAEGTSISSRDRDCRFFLEMASAFAARGQAHFGELLVNGRVIASTCNFASGNTLFGFKIGWDPEFAAGSPGVWSEVKLLDALPHLLPHIARVDSCAGEDSYVTAAYRDRVPTASSVLVWSRRAETLCLLRAKVQQLKRQLRKPAGNDRQAGEEDD